MIHTIRVYTTEGNDTRGDSLLRDLQTHQTITGIQKIKTARVYRIEGVLQKEAEKLAVTLFAESINQGYTLNTPLFEDAQATCEIAYKPGVMNPEVASIFKCAHDLKINPTAVDSSTLYAFYASTSSAKLTEIIQNAGLYNPMVEIILEKEPKTLQIQGKRGKTQIIPIRKLTDEELMKLSENKLFLNLTEMKTIQKHFRDLQRDPTDCELEVLAQTWSEHCVHKTFKSPLIIDGKRKPPLFERIKKTAIFNNDSIVSAFVDNSGVIDFYDGYAICGKVETHNSPSAIEPYGGAMTGSGGVFRDILGTGKGAKPIVSTDIFCLAPPDLPDSQIPPGCLKPSSILTKVIEGVRDYGNRVGIPTNNGSLHFHEDFRAKPTVAVGSYGIIPKKNAYKQQPKKGQLILTIGGKTGRDGIHGATFSSAEMTDTTKIVSGSAVQIGNAIEEKRVIDAVLALSGKNLIHAITDCGAGGYSSAIGEMAEKTGAKVYLERVPLKYDGLAPWEIFLSESQERMVLAIDPKKLTEVLNVCKQYNVECAVIGEFTDTKKLEVFFSKKKVCDLSMDFLHNGLPLPLLTGKTAKRNKTVKSKTKPHAISPLIKKILAHPTIASKEAIIRQYDHNVKGSNALHPFGGVHFDGPNDGAIVRPLLDKPYGLVTTHGLNPLLNRFDTYWGAIWAVAEAVSNYVAVGGDIKEAALIDNFIWPFPDEESLADLDRAVDACSEMANILSMPFVSGKDSLSSTYRYPDGKVLTIPPVVLISVFGRIPDVSKTVSSDFKHYDSVIVQVGALDRKNMAGSIYNEVTNTQGGEIPRVDIKNIKNVCSSITEGIQNKAIFSCHDISEGGLLTALSEMCFGGDMGATITIPQSEMKDHIPFLFNETAGVFLVEVESDKTAKALFRTVPYQILGTTHKEKEITILNGSATVAKERVQTLKHAWQKPIKELFS